MISGGGSDQRCGAAHWQAARPAPRTSSPSAVDPGGRVVRRVERVRDRIVQDPRRRKSDDHGMKIDVHAAASFMAMHGRVLDRRRLQLLVGEANPGDVLAALDAYRNPDGGYAWGLEPDLRSAENQPAAAMHALEVLAEAAPSTTPRAVELCDWLQRHTLADGGLPFALPVGDPAGCAPFWVQAGPRTSSLQMTAQVAANAHLLGHHQPDIAAHRWLAT